jgi:2-hydroxy-6-oxonona-2,4-dienedioate hydrolase
LPGAAGLRSFWEPVAAILDLGPDALLLGWPGFGDEPAAPAVRGLGDLTGWVLDRVEGELNLVAQSMGGVVALSVALEAPERVRRLVLCATSGGVDFGGVGREDWRAAYLREMPDATPRWFVDDRTDVTARLAEVRAPALLVWGSEDRIVPPAAGRRLEQLLPDSRMEVVSGGGHDVARTHAPKVAACIGPFLAGRSANRVLSDQRRSDNSG